MAPWPRATSALRPTKLVAKGVHHAVGGDHETDDVGRHRHTFAALGKPVSEDKILCPITAEVGKAASLLEGLFAQDHGDTECKFSATQHVCDEYTRTHFDAFTQCVEPQGQAGCVDDTDIEA